MLESSCKTWNRLLKGFHPGQLSFLLRTTSDSYSSYHCEFTEMVIPRCEKIALWLTAPSNCSYFKYSCPVALTQQLYACCHSLQLCSGHKTCWSIFWPSSILLKCLLIYLISMLIALHMQSTILSSLFITPYRPDIVIYNSQSPSITSNLPMIGSKTKLCIHSYWLNLTAKILPTTMTPLKSQF